MPITTSILEQNVLGSLLLKGRREGMGMVVRGVIELRFGALPGWANEKLSALSTSGLEGLIRPVLHATSLEDILK